MTRQKNNIKKLFTKYDDVQPSEIDDLYSMECQATLHPTCKINLGKFMMKIKQLNVIYIFFFFFTKLVYEKSH